MRRKGFFLDSGHGSLYKTIRYNKHLLTFGWLCGVSDSSELENTKISGFLLSVSAEFPENPVS